MYGVLGSAIGLAWANATLAIAAYCGREYGADSGVARTVIGIGLASLAWICKLKQSPLLTSKYLRS
jgi:hypothetical protein